MQEAVLALLAKEPSHGYELRARLRQALGHGTVPAEGISHDRHGPRTGAACPRAVQEYGKDAGLVRAVDGVDLDVAPGETVAVTGPSGCGKSTLLHLAGGLERPTSGVLWLAGKRIDTMSERALARLRRNVIGFVFRRSS